MADNNQHSGFPSQKADSGLNRQRVAITIDPELIDIGKRVAAEGKMSFSQLIERLLKSEIDQPVVQPNRRRR